MLGVLVEGIKKVGDWIEKTFGSPDIDKEIEKLFMENEEQEELNVIMETEENQKNELIKEVEKYEDEDNNQRYQVNQLLQGFMYGFVLGLPFGSPYAFFFYDDYYYNDD